MKKYNKILKFISFLFLTLIHQKSYGQFKESKSPLDNQDINKYKSLVEASMNEHDKKIYIKWSVINDSLEGYFVVYKSKGLYGSTKMIEMINYPKVLIKNQRISISSVDKNPDSNYDVYYILKIDKNSQQTISEDMLWQSSIATLFLKSKNKELTHQDYTKIYPQ